MRKNLLLLIMFCLIATIGANATATKSGNTLTIKTENAGEMGALIAKSYITDASITSIVVDGYVKLSDIEAVAGMPKVVSLDLTLAKINSSSDWNLSLKFNKEVTVGETNYTNNFPFQLQTIKFPKPANTGIHEIPSLCMQGYQALVNIIIPIGYTKIGDNAFDAQLQKDQIGTIQIINLPEGIKTIGNTAFANSSIKSIRLPNSLETIGSDAFVNCASLASITIPAKVTSIGDRAFNGCNRIKDVYVLAPKPPKLGDLSFSLESRWSCGGGFPNNEKIKSAKRANYWDEGLNTNNLKPYIAVLHYPKDHAGDYTYTDLVALYSLTSDDGILVKYPTETDAKRIGEKQDKEKDLNVGWKTFVLSAEMTGEIEPIPHIVASRWYTMCFDFDMTKGQIESAFGDGTEVCRFQGVKYTNDGNNNVTATLDFSEDEYNTGTLASTTITKAGYPYMIHPAAAAPDGNTEPIYYVMGITKVKGCTEKPDYGKKFFSIIDGTKTEDKVSGYYPYESYAFKGTLSEIKVPSNSYYLGLWNDTKTLDNTEDGHRAFFYHPATSTSSLTLPAYAATLSELGTTNYHGSNPTANAKKTGTVLGGDAVIFTSDNSTTGIENTESENSNETSAKFADKVFSISGQLVRTGSSSLEGLAKGMYIVNGKKYIVR